MKPFYWMILAAALLAPAGLRAEEPASAGIEQQVAALVARPEVTIVHLWAPWCGNCKNELKPDGWGKFVREHPTVKVVFVNIWHKGQDPVPRLAAAGLAGGGEGAANGNGPAPENFLALTHPNASTARADKLSVFLGQPVAWVPTTWVYREGKLRYALNYGEVRFDMLGKMVEDAAAKW